VNVKLKSSDTIIVSTPKPPSTKSIPLPTCQESFPDVRVLVSLPEVPL
jgi:hypothetical protein